MKSILRATLVALVVVLFTPPALAEDAKAGAAKAKPSAKPAAKAGGFVTKTPDELKWIPNPANPDVQMAVMWGDPAKGAHGAFHKFKAGFDAGLHSHSSDIRVAVVSGTIIAGPAGGPERKLPAGSYEYQPHGVKHVTKCDAASECIIFAMSSGKFDLTPAEEPKK